LIGKEIQKELKTAQRWAVLFKGGYPSDLISEKYYLLVSQSFSEKTNFENK